MFFSPRHVVQWTGVASQMRCVAGQQPLEARAGPAGWGLSGGPWPETADGLHSKREAPGCVVLFVCLFAAATAARGVRAVRTASAWGCSWGGEGCYTRRPASPGAHGVGRRPGSEGATAAARALREVEEVKAASLAARFT
jgi:hypothetical protein